ncbi:MAG: GYD domain-containing protein [Chloroflexi bacterium]|nr:GYD domain-containing protein [Chloroflexota bacterium]
MATYVLLSTLTDEGRRTVKERPERIQEVNKEIEAWGAKVVAQYAVLGPYDFVNIVEAPDNETIAKVSVELGSRGTVQIMSLPAITIETFAKKIKGSSASRPRAR